MPEWPRPVKKQRHVSAATAAWLRQKVRKTRESGLLSQDALFVRPDDPKVVQRAARSRRKQAVRYQIYGDMHEIKNQVRGLRSLRELYDSPFRRRVAVFFSSKQAQLALKGLRKDLREKVMAVGDPQPAARIASLHAMADAIKESPELLERFISFFHFSLKDPSPDVTAASMVLMGEIRVQPAIQRTPQLYQRLRSSVIPVSKLLANANPEVVRNALRFMEYFGYDSAFSRVVGLTRLIDDARRSDTLIKRLGREPSKDEVYSRKTLDHSVRRNAARYLSYFANSKSAEVAMRDPELVKIIYGNLTDSDVELRRVSAQLLAAYPQSLKQFGAGKKLIPILGRYFAAEKDELVRDHLKQLTGALSES